MAVNFVLIRKFLFGMCKPFYSVTIGCCVTQLQCLKSPIYAFTHIVCCCLATLKIFDDEWKSMHFAMKRCAFSLLSTLRYVSRFGLSFGVLSHGRRRFMGACEESSKQIVANSSSHFRCASNCVERMRLIQYVVQRMRCDAETEHN